MDKRTNGKGEANRWTSETVCCLYARY